MDTSLEQTSRTAPRNRRRNLLINKDFQYRQLIISVASVVILVNMIAIATFLVTGPSRDGTVPWLEIGLLATLEVAVLGIVVFGSLKLSLAVAGPMHVLVRELDRIAAGDLTGETQFRKEDQFHEVAEHLNLARQSWVERIRLLREIRDKLQSAEDDASQSVASRQLNKTLTEIHID